MGDDSFEFENRHGHLSLTRTWSRPAAWAAFTWVLIWSAMVVFFSTLGGHALREAPWFLALPAVAMGYVALARALNRTEVTVRSDAIVIRHGPVPWPGSRTVDPRDARAIHTRLRIVHTRGAEVHQCRIQLECANGRRATLLEGLDMSAIEMARASAQMAKFLQIPVVND